MGALKTSMNSTIRMNGGSVGTVTNAEVESSSVTLGNFRLGGNMDMAATWTVILFIGAVIFLYVIL